MVPQVQSERSKAVLPSDIRRLFDLAQGVPGIISLGIGEPDFVTPEHIRNAAKKALDDGQTHYAPSRGIPALGEEVAKRYLRDYNVTVDPRRQFFDFNGGIQALFYVAFASINPGDEVLVPDPGFLCYPNIVLSAGGKIVEYPCPEENDFKPDFDALEATITPRTKAAILNFPCNPTGAHLHPDEMKRLVKILIQHDILIISDEVYDNIIYDDYRPVSALEYGTPDQMVVINSFSKSYAMTGWRIGYTLGPEVLMNAIERIYQNSQTCINTVAQHAAVAALTGPQDFIGKTTLRASPASCRTEPFTPSQTSPALSSRVPENSPNKPSSRPRSCASPGILSASLGKGTCA
jgi:aminotransferase